MHFDDLLAGYWVRHLQASIVVHVCMIGYCRMSWNSPCKPETEVVESMCEDNENLRMRPRKTHLRDDAYNKVTQLSALVSSGMNVQINQHHPHGAHNGLLYHVKYQLKPEPTTVV
eukprot:3756191-Karenia_brevis.AAC.1